MPTFKTYIYSNDGNTLYGMETTGDPGGPQNVVAQNGIVEINTADWTAHNGATISEADNSFILPITIQGLTLTANSTNIDVAIGQSIISGNTYYCVEAATPTLTFKHFFDAGTIGSGTVKFRHYSQQAQLATPQNVAASGTIVSWGAVENATSYEILVSGSSFGTVSTTSVDLSTLSGWASLTDGEYSITIVAKADGYRDSEPSAAVSVTKQGGGSNVVIKAGTYKWVDTPDIQGITDIIGEDGGIDGQFKSSDITFDYLEFSVHMNKIRYEPSKNFASLAELVEEGEEVDEVGYQNGEWYISGTFSYYAQEPSLQTFIVLEDINLTSVWNDTEIEQAILTWFTANTTKLS